MKAVPLLDVVENVTGGPSWFSGTRRYFATADVEDSALRTGVLVTFENRPSRANLVGRSGDVLFAKMQATEKVFHITSKASEAIFSTGFFNLRPRRGKISSRYLFWFLRSKCFQAGKDRLCTGATQKAITLGGLEKISISLPDTIEEQEAIAASLDKADAVRRKREQALSLADDFLPSVFMEIFGDRDWPSVPLAEAVADGTIVTYGIVQAGPEIDGGIPYIRTGDIKNGEILVDGLRHTSPEIASKFTRSKVRCGEIVMSIRATVGTTAIVPPELDGANLTQGTARIAPGENTTLEYLLSYLRSQNAQAWIEGQVKGATFREITLTRLRELPVPIPPLEVQLKFSAIYQKNRSAWKRLKDDAASATDLFAFISQRAFASDL